MTLRHSARITKIITLLHSMSQTSTHTFHYRDNCAIHSAGSTYRAVRETLDDALIQIYHCRQIHSGGDTVSVARDKSEVDLLKLTDSNMGIDVVWEPFKRSEWVLNLIKGIFGLALEMIPEIGSLMSTAFTMGLTLIFDPESSDAEYAADLGTAAIVGLHDQANNCKRFLPQEFLDLTVQQNGSTPSGTAITPVLSLLGNVSAEEVVDNPNDKVMRATKMPPNPVFANGLSPPSSPVVANISATSGELDDQM